MYRSKYYRSFISQELQSQNLKKKLFIRLIKFKVC